MTAIKKTDLVVKSNKLIEASYRLDLVEQRIILASIVSARESQKCLGEDFVMIEALWFAKMFRMGESKVYEQLKEAIDSLFERFLVIRDICQETGKERVTKLRWISRASYLDGAGRIQLRFSTDIIPYITQLEAEFTRYKLEQIAGMKSAYAIRPYELLVQWGSIGRREVELEWLKNILVVDRDYGRLDNFKRKVIDIAVKQINEHSDLDVSYTQRKTGRTVSHLIFEFSSKASKQPPKTAARTRAKPKPVSPEVLAVEAAGRVRSDALLNEYNRRHGLPLIGHTGA